MLFSGELNVTVMLSIRRHLFHLLDCVIHRSEKNWICGGKKDDSDTRNVLSGAFSCITMAFFFFFVQFVLCVQQIKIVSPYFGIFVSATERRVQFPGTYIFLFIPDLCITKYYNRRSKFLQHAVKLL